MSGFATFPLFGSSTNIPPRIGLKLKLLYNQWDEITSGI